MVRKCNRLSADVSRRGASLIEFVLCIPLLAFVIGLTFFFGWAMSNQQGVKISGRYAVWREVRGGGAADPRDLNRKFYSQKAGGVSVDGRQATDETLRDLVDAAGDVSTEAKMLADHLVLDRFPRGVGAEVAAEFPTDVGLWNQLGGGAIRHRHMREGVEWRRGQASCEEVVRDDFLIQLDGALRRLSSTPGAEFGQVLRNLYEYRW